MTEMEARPKKEKAPWRSTAAGAPSSLLTFEFNGKAGQFQEDQRCCALSGCCPWNTHIYIYIYMYIQGKSNRDCSVLSASSWAEWSVGCVYLGATCYEPANY